LGPRTKFVRHCSPIRPCDAVVSRRRGLPPRDSRDLLARPQEAACRSCSSSRPHRAARQFVLVGVAFRGCTSMLFVVAVLSGRTMLLFCQCGLLEPRDSCISLARPFVATRQFRLWLQPSQGHMTVSIHWHSRLRRRVESVHCCSPFGLRQWGFTGATCLSPRISCVRHRGPFGPRDAVFSSLLPFGAARQFGLAGTAFVGCVTICS